MADSDETRMNLAALKRVDSNIKLIIDNASQVALYKFSPKANEWEKTEIEGTLFVYERSQKPHHGFIIMNRLNTTNLTEPITEEIEFQLQSPFLLYRNVKCNIYGIWFYENEECTRLGQLMNSLKSSLPGKIKRDTNAFRGLPSYSNSIKHERNGPHRPRCVSESESHKNKDKKSGKLLVKDVDIISLLSRAQDEYDKKSNNCVNNRYVNDKNEPKKVAKSITESGHDKVIKPTPMRIDNKNSSAIKQSTPLSVDSLFAQVSQYSQEIYSLENDRNQDSLMRTRSFSSAGSYDTKAKDNAGTILQRLLSNPANTVEHIEKLQRNEVSFGDGSKTNVDTQLTNVNHTMNSTGNNVQPTTVESLEHDLKEKLKIISGLRENSQKEGMSPLPVAGICTKSPATIIEESSNFLSLEKLSNIEPLNLRISPKQESVIHPILTPAAFENCVGQNQLVDTSSSLMDLPGGNMESQTTNDSFSLQIIPRQPSSQPMTLITPMAFATTNNSTNGTLSNSTPLLDNPPIDILSTNNAHIGASPGASSGLLLPHHLVNGVTPSVNTNENSKVVRSGISPLTRDQLKEALLYMLQNDAEFLSKIHESYINSLKTHLNTIRS
ncbi:mRNA-decapping enzyme 1B-like [Centruroides sculpturatus]|uniref:mRNA-decapping enzyme 1B-like n=1 Tax=Centruroides sculpturatus TaxID=218467 RepID=UPI000C6CBFCE|nr:mRNA-decapping enzyme 1B-like [Centruroides sculpturatus]